MASTSKKSNPYTLFLGPALFLLVLLIGGTASQVRMLAIALWMLSWWFTNAVPLGVTALLPIVLYPIMGIVSLKEVTGNYANPIIYLFLGGFMLGLAIEKWNLHKRIAINILRFSGTSPKGIILGSMLATSLLSMWISNTATTLMMLPIGMSIIGLLGDKFSDSKSGQNFTISLLLGLAYAANIGGMTTLVGTPPNLVLGAMVSDGLGFDLNFSDWFFFAFPLVILLFISTLLLNLKLIFPIKISKLDGVKELIQSELSKLGKMGSGELRVLLIFASTALLWIFRGSLTKIDGFANLSDPIIAIVATIGLFALPSGEQGQRILIWKDTRKLPWDILLLFGGGLALAQGLKETQIVELIGSFITDSPIQSTLILILVVCGVSIFLTEVMSNVALVSVFIPITFIIAESFKLNGLQLAIPLTLGASCAFMFPIATPPNAIVFSSEKITIKQMAKAGVLINIVSLLLISLYSYLFLGEFFIL